MLKRSAYILPTHCFLCLCKYGLLTRCSAQKIAKLFVACIQWRNMAPDQSTSKSLCLIRFIFISSLHKMYVLAIRQFFLVRATILVLKRLCVVSWLVILAIKMIQLLMFGFFALWFLFLNILNITESRLVAVDVVDLKGFRRLVAHLLPD